MHSTSLVVVAALEIRVPAGQSLTAEHSRSLVRGTGAVDSNSDSASHVVNAVHFRSAVAVETVETY